MAGLKKFRLGPDFEARLSELVDEYLQEKREKHEVRGRLQEFKKSENYFRLEAERRLAIYERYCSELRERNGLSPFDWSRESVDCGRKAIRGGKLPQFRKPKVWPGEKPPAFKNYRYSRGSDDAEAEKELVEVRKVVTSTSKVRLVKKAARNK